MEITRPLANIAPGPQLQAQPEVKEAVKSSASIAAVVAEDVSRPESPETTDLESVVAEISDYVQDKQRSLQFRVSDSGPAVIEVYDKATEQLIREIPSQEAQRIAEILREQFGNGLLVKLEV